MDDQKQPEEPTGRAKGGKARAEALTPTERKEIARKAAAARWDKPMPKAIFEGVLQLGDIKIPCAVLDDGRRVLTQSGFMRAIGRARQAKGRSHYDGDVTLPAFLTAKNLKPFIGDGLEVTSSQFEFIRLNGGVAFGYMAELLPKVCEVYITAEPHLAKTQLHVAQRAKILLFALANTGIVALVDEATGYQSVRPADALQKYLEMIVRKELAVWAKKFPDEFYENIYKLRGWPWPGMKKNRYSVVAHYTRDLVYERMAPGLLRELESKSPKDDKGQRDNKLHQWLTGDVGDPMLASHLQSLLTLQRLALANGWGWHRFMNMVNQIMKRKGDNLDLAFPIEDDSNASPQPS